MIRLGVSEARTRYTQNICIIANINIYWLTVVICILYSSYKIISEIKQKQFAEKIIEATMKLEAL